MKKTLLTVIIGIVLSNGAIFADTSSQDALEAEQKYRKAERIYQKRLEEKERERVIKQRELKNERCKQPEETEKPRESE